MQRQFNRNLKRFGIGLFQPGGGAVPFKDNLNTWHKGIDSITFNESINNLPAKFLARVADFDSTSSDYIDTGVKLSGNSFDITLEGQKVSGDFMSLMQGDAFSVNRTGVTWHQDDKIYCIVGAGTLRAGVSAAITNFDYKKIRCVYDGNGATDADKIKLYINDVFTPFDSFTGVIPSSITASVTTLRIGEGYAGSQYTDGIIGHVKSLGQFEYYPTGQGSHEYDISTNGNHGVINGTGTRFDYDKEGSTYPNTQGYSLWQLTANPDIQVPFDINGLPLALTAGVNIPAGYTKTRDIVAGGSKWNMEDSLVDMEYGSILQNDTAGMAYATQNDAYGLVFDGILNKGGDGNILPIGFISQNIVDFSSLTGYTLQSFTDEGLYLVKRPTETVLFGTSASYILNNTDYRLFVWRNETLNQYVTGAIGTFAVYIQGKNKTITTTKYTIPNIDEMELVDVSGGSGSNPVTDNTYTTSLYQVNYLLVGDQVSKINVNGKYISPYDFTVSTGAYSIIDNPDNAIFNRINATRQTVFSRASLFYDANHPFIYHVTELADPRIYNKSGAEFFEALYRDIIFGKVKRVGNDIIEYQEESNYANQKAGADLTKVTNYNNITDIYHI